MELGIHPGLILFCETVGYYYLRLFWNVIPVGRLKV